MRRAPIAGALVELRAAEGGAAVQMFTSPSGAFVFTASASQHYRLRVAAIGYARHPIVDVAASTDVVKLPDIVLTPIAVTLPELHAMAGRRACGRSEVTPETFGGLLDGAQTALQVMHATMDSRQVAFEVQLIHTITMHKARDSSMSADTSRASVHEWPVRSLSLDSLQLVGFARNGTAAEGGGQFFDGPDLEVLFSDWFLESHCFTLDKKRSRDDTVFIRFDPAGKSKLVDVGGELVLEPDDADTRATDVRPPKSSRRHSGRCRRRHDAIPAPLGRPLGAGRLVDLGPDRQGVASRQSAHDDLRAGPGRPHYRADDSAQPPTQLFQVVGRDERRGRLTRVLSAPGS